MDNLLEIIGPLIVGAIYVLGSIFAKKNAAEDRPPAPRQRSRPEQDPDYADHQYEDQDEIRQKIMERQSGQSTQAAPNDTP